MANWTREKQKTVLNLRTKGLFESLSDAEQKQLDELICERDAWRNERAPEIKKAMEHFRDAILGAKTKEDLVAALEKEEHRVFFSYFFIR